METDGIPKVVTNMTEMETIGVLFSTALGGVAAGFCAGEVSGEGVAEEREGAGVEIVAVDSLEGTLPEQSLVSHFLQRFQSESGYIPSSDVRRKCTPRPPNDSHRRRSDYGSRF